MAAPFGNKNARKLVTPDLRKKAYEGYCAWLAKGKSPRSFTFQEGDLKCTGQTIESYIKEDSIEFPPIHKQFAFSQGMAIWEQVVEDSAKGLNKEANTASLQMLMRNKYGWDKEEKNSDLYQASEQTEVTIANMKEANGQNSPQSQTATQSEGSDSKA